MSSPNLVNNSQWEVTHSLHGRLWVLAVQYHDLNFCCRMRPLTLVWPFDLDHGLFTLTITFWPWTRHFELDVDHDLLLLTMTFHGQMVICQGLGLNNPHKYDIYPTEVFSCPIFTICSIIVLDLLTFNVIFKVTKSYVIGKVLISPTKDHCGQFWNSTMKGQFQGHGSGSSLQAQGYVPSTPMTCYNSYLMCLLIAEAWPAIYPYNTHGPTWVPMATDRLQNNLP